MPFTPEELEAMRIADAEIDEGVFLTEEEIRDAALRDKEARDQYRTQKQIRRTSYNKTYYLKNRERIAAKNREYHAEHKTEIAIRKAAWYQENRADIRERVYNRDHGDIEKTRAKRRDYYAKNREAVLARNKRYRDRRKARLLAKLET